MNTEAQQLIAALNGASQRCSQAARAAEEASERVGDHDSAVHLERAAMLQDLSASCYQAAAILLQQTYGAPQPPPGGFPTLPVHPALQAAADAASALQQPHSGMPITLPRTLPQQQLGLAPAPAPADPASQG